MQQRTKWTRKFYGVLAGLGCLAILSSSAYAQDISELIQVTKGDRSIRGTGFLPADPEKYRALDEAPRTRGPLPPRKDLSDRFPTPSDQGQQSSCSAWAVGYAARSYYIGKDTGGDPRRGENIASPAHIYSSLNRSGRCNQEVATIDVLELLKNVGTVPLSVTGYWPDRCDLQIPASVLALHSQRFRIQGYDTVAKADETHIKSQINRNNPVIFGMYLTDEFNSWERTVFTSTQRDGRAHSMVITGYDDARQAYKFINSWGNEWGERGYGWLSYQAAKALWIEGYVIRL